MMKKQRGMWLLVGIWFFVQTSLPTTRAQTEVPWLYYYSTEQTTFISERADGSASRVFTQNFYSFPGQRDIELQDDGEYPALLYDIPIGGPGWSPTGSWFAWGNKGDFLYDTVMVTDRSGDIVQTFDELRDFRGAIWSSSEDILQIKISVKEHNQPCLADLNSPKPVKKLCLEGVTDGRWSPDGNYIRAFVTSSIGKGELIVRIYSRFGELIAERTIIDTLSLSFWTRLWLGGSLLTYIQPEGMIIEDVETNKRAVMPWEPLNIMPWGPVGFRNVNFNPNAQQALFEWADWTSPSLNAQLHLFSSEDYFLTPIVDDAQIVQNPKTLLYSSFRAEEFNKVPNYAQQVWTSDGKQVLFRKDEQLFMLDTDTLKQHPVSPDLPGQIGMFQFLTDDTLMFSFAGELYHYDTDTHRREELPYSLPNPITLFSVSPDGRYIALRHGDDGMMLLDTQIQHMTALAYDAPEFPIMNSFGNFIWHPDSRWLLTTSYTSYNTLIGVVDAEAGTIRRLGICNYLAACFGWVPPQQ